MEPSDSLDDASLNTDVSLEGVKLAVVDDDPIVRRLVSAWVARRGGVVKEFSTGRAIIDESGNGWAAICLDLGLEDIHGLDVLQHLRAAQPDTPVIVVTGHKAVEPAVAAMQHGAYDYLTKPIQEQRFIVSIQHAVERSKLTAEVRKLNARVEGQKENTPIGRSKKMTLLANKIERVLMSDAAVCIFGESGTGKELVAHAIHDGGRRKLGPFVGLNCATIPENLQESELFGHEKGAFTGATSTYHGRFEEAEGGTLFLDEIGEMSLSTQAKLLRVLQENTIRRVGGVKDIRTNARIVCATHRDLEQHVAAGKFREDLYFRLMVYPVEVPPLRERGEDIPLLVAHFFRALREDVGRDINRVALDALEALVRYEWPGNVRELRNTIHRAMLACEDDEIRLADLPAKLKSTILPDLPAARPSVRPNIPPELPLLQLSELERLATDQALRQTAGHIGQAAKLLGIGRATLYRRIMDEKAAEPATASEIRERRKAQSTR